MTKYHLPSPGFARLRDDVRKAARLRMRALRIVSEPKVPPVESQRVCYKAAFLRNTGAGRLDPRWGYEGEIVGYDGRWARVKWSDGAETLVAPENLTHKHLSDADASSLRPYNAR